MERATRLLLDQLDQLVWFVQVGQEHLGPVPRVFTWRQAVDLLDSQVCEERWLDEANRIRLQLSDTDVRFWNPLVEQIKPEVEEIVEKQLRQAKVPHDVIERVAVAARWDLLHACMEREFETALKSRFYTGLAQWYLLGHFPCGWSSQKEQYIVY